MFLAGALFNVQILNGEQFVLLAKNNRVRRIYVPAQRGKIFDRKGNLLVDNRPSYNVEVTREEIRNRAKLVENLSTVLEMTPKQLNTRINNTASFSYMPSTVKRDVDQTLLVRLEEDSYFLPGVDISVNPVRNYIHHSIGAHMFGIVGKIPEKKLDAFLEKGYKRQDTIGLDGLEAEYEKYLQGTGGGMQVQVDSRGIKDQILGSVPPLPGQNMYLTIDRDIQYELSKLYEDKIGAGVVMNYKTGEILAMGSFPAYDPNVFVRPLTKKKFKEIYLNPESPLTNRAIAGAYPPGSVFKPCVALAGLSSKTINEHTTAFCNGSFYLGKAKFRCWKKYGHGRVNVVDALKYSCNIFFYNMAVDLGPENIYKYASMFGFGNKTGIDLPNEKAGLLPNTAWKKAKMKEGWYGGESVNYSIGQGYILVTPLQVCVYTGGLATNGTTMVPHILGRFVNAKQETTFEKQPTVANTATLDPRAVELVREGMKQVVQASDGTGRRANVKELDVRGKTGTAQYARRGEMIKCTWFIAYVVSDIYPVAVTLLVEEGISGGSTNAPMCRQLLEKIVEVYQPDNKQAT